MGHARHKLREADERLESANIENTNVLDERKVLELLETALDGSTRTIKVEPSRNRFHKRLP